MLSYMAEMLQQNQTLSLRISEVLRKRLEDIRKLTAIRKGESVSTSEIAKQLLESAREERFEVVELLNRPAEALLEIRRKGEAGQMLTRAQWTVVAYFVQQGVRGVFQKSPRARIVYRNTEGVRRGAPAPRQAVRAGRVLPGQPAERLPAGAVEAV